MGGDIECLQCIQECQGPPDPSSVPSLAPARRPGQLARSPGPPWWRAAGSLLTPLPRRLHAGSRVTWQTVNAATLGFLAWTSPITSTFPPSLRVGQLCHFPGPYSRGLSACLPPHRPEPQGLMRSRGAWRESTPPRLLCCFQNFLLPIRLCCIPRLGAALVWLLATYFRIMVLLVEHKDQNGEAPPACRAGGPSPF